MAAGNRRGARRTTAGEGTAWVVALAGNVLDWVRDLTEDGDVGAQPGPGCRDAGTNRRATGILRTSAGPPHPSE
eukprot:9123078-Alexandrium_andersonii.AAC.1